jgi:hypothetical protein
VGIVSPLFRWTDSLFVGIVEPSLAGREGIFPMNDAERFRPLGTYQTPRFRIGQRVRCQMRGEVIITGISDAPIGWPIAKGARGRRSLVVYKGLARAVCRESKLVVQPSAQSEEWLGRGVRRASCRNVS